MEKSLRESLLKIQKKYNQLKNELLDEKIMTNIKEYNEKSKEKKMIEKIVINFDMYLYNEKTLIDNKKMILTEKDPEILEMAKIEIDEAILNNEKIMKKIKNLLIPKDPYDHKNVIMEIQGAAGGEEANLFAANLFDIYKKWASLTGFKIKILNSNISENGGFTNICFKIIGENIYSKMKFETGVHRVQRVPKTETQGRVHTSTVKVLVMPESDENDEIIINNADLKIDTFRASGAGGQHVNTTDSAVRILHIPTGIIVQSQDGRSQLKNKDIAIEVLKTKLLEKQIQEKEEKEAGYRKKTGSGARSEKIRTYNFPQDRVTDHRTKVSVSLKDFIEGKINNIIESLIAKERAEKISASAIK